MKPKTWNPQHDTHRMKPTIALGELLRRINHMALGAAVGIVAQADVIDVLRHGFSYLVRPA